MSTRHRYHRWTAAAAIGYVLLPAACGSTSTGSSQNLPANLNTQSPAYQSAEKACQGLIGFGESGPARNPALVAKARQAALAHAQCVREHGVPNFPDPTISTNGGGIAHSFGGPRTQPPIACLPSLWPRERLLSAWP